MDHQEQLSAIVIALYKVMGCHSSQPHEHEIPMMNLYSGIMIGLQIGQTDVHSARKVFRAINNGSEVVDDFHQNVVNEILRVVDE